MLASSAREAGPGQSRSVSPCGGGPAGRAGRAEVALPTGRARGAVLAATLCVI